MLPHIAPLRRETRPAGARRRWLISVFAALVAPLSARSQSRVFRIGLLGGSSRTSRGSAHIWDGFFEGMRTLGYVEGQNIAVEERWYGNDVERLPALADELVKLRVDLIVAGTQPAPEAARRATPTIPIVMINHGDPVGSGLVASLARPGGNVTGISLNGLALRGKQLQLLAEAVPGLTSVAVLTSPDIAFHRFDMRELTAAARALKIQVQTVAARTPGEFADAFSAAARRRAGAILILGSSMYFAHRAELAQLALRHRLPALYGAKEFPEAGGLMSYGVDFREAARQAAGYAGKILKGARPGDLPVEEPSKFELVINLQSAKSLGIAIPGAMFARADRLIE